eukprot:TRINITY_DN12439_c0_g2_i1.p1 TRINITY_DN12439_c0_g2~~TRINITY_DN12439_c0_g2_i1.p1  ORF type:complete len:309 (+),score=60.65 TRINITY_DN12439_c0_g2_i1:32-958(+)
MIVEEAIRPEPRRSIELSGVAKVFLLCVSLEALAVVVLSILQRYLQHLPTDDHMKISVLMCLSVVFLAYFAIDGVINENRFELVCFLVVSLLITFYSAFNFFTLPDTYTSRPATVWIRFIAIMAFSPINIILGWLSYKSFGWRLYRKIGANADILHMYRTYQIFLSFLKMDLQFGLTIVLGVGMFLHPDNLELYLDLVFFLITLGWAVLGWYGIRHELTSLVIVFFMFALVEPGYIIWKIIAALEPHDEFDQIGYLGPALALCGLALLCRFLLILWTGFTFRSFHKGLRQVFEKEEDSREDTGPNLSG